MTFLPEDNPQEREVVSKFLEKHYEVVEGKLSKEEWERRSRQGNNRMLELCEKIHAEKSTKRLLEEMARNLDMGIRDLQITVDYSRIEAAFEKYAEYEKFTTGDTLLQKELREFEWKAAKELAETYSKKYYEELGMIREVLKVRLVAEYLISKMLWLLGKLNAILAMKKPPSKPGHGNRLPKRMQRKKEPKKKKYEWEENMMYG